MMFQDTAEGATQFYCACVGTRTYQYEICTTCGGTEPPPADLVAEVRRYEADHEPDGWPAVRMRQISALCDEIERLRRGEFICRKCGLRKDSEPSTKHEF